MDPSFDNLSAHNTCSWVNCCIMDECRTQTTDCKSSKHPSDSQSYTPLLTLEQLNERIEGIAHHTSAHNTCDGLAVVGYMTARNGP
jgi:hypothetical protein